MRLGGVTRRSILLDRLQETPNLQALGSACLAHGMALKQMRTR